jgi:hypothetical protein
MTSRCGLLHAKDEGVWHLLLRPQLEAKSCHSCMSQHVVRICRRGLEGEEGCGSSCDDDEDAGRSADACSLSLCNKCAGPQTCCQHRPGAMHVQASGVVHCRCLPRKGLCSL